MTYSVVSGPASLSGNIVTLMGTGMVVLQASQVAAGAYTASTATTTFAVNGIAPGLAFNPVADQMYGALPFPVFAQSSSTAAMTYSVVSGPATIANTTVTVTAVGVVTLQVSQPAAGRYAAGTAQVSFAVKPVAPTLALVPVLPQVYGAAPFVISSVSNSSGGNTYSVVSGPATIEGNMVTVTGAGTVSLMVSQNAAGNYSAATATMRMKVLPGVPTLAFARVAAQTFGGAPFAVSASSLSTGAVTYSVVSGPATVTGNTIAMSGAGAITIAASQAATVNYTAAVALTTVVVNKERPSVTMQLSTPLVMYLTPVSFEARVMESGKTAPTGTVQVFDGSTVIGMYAMNAFAAGDLRSLLPANLTVGVHNLSFVYLGDANYTSTNSASVTLTVRPRLVGLSHTL